jgi:alcohol dehydrogenase class IV
MRRRRLGARDRIVLEPSGQSDLVGAGRSGGRVDRRSLPDAVANLADPQPRESLALAATLAGAAFSPAGVVVPHAIAQALGGVLHVPHGLSVALATRQGLDFNREVCTAQYAELARCCRLSADNDETLADEFVATVNDILDRCDLPRTIAVPREAPDGLIGTLVRNAYDSTPVPITLNPRRVNEDEMRGFFERILSSR